MKAALIYRPGGPEALKLEDIPEPVAGEGEVLVRVRAAALNRLDLSKQLAGEGLSPGAGPYTGGAEMAGEIVELGLEVRGFQIGQRVVVYPYLGCGHCANCRSGAEQLCSVREIPGPAIQGAYAEYAAVPARALLKMPENLEFEEAAAQVLTGALAWRMLVAKGGVRPGEQVLVQAAGSGTGSAAIQIAHLWGAQVIAVTSSREKMDRAEDLGADQVIDYYEKDLIGEILEITGGRGVDIAIEPFAAETLPASLKCLATGGRLIYPAGASSRSLELNLPDLAAREIMFLACSGGSRDELQQLFRMQEEGRLSAVIDRTYPLAGIAEAQQRLLDRQQFGKIVLI